MTPPQAGAGEDTADGSDSETTDAPDSGTGNTPDTETTDVPDSHTADASNGNTTSEGSEGDEVGEDGDAGSANGVQETGANGSTGNGQAGLDAFVSRGDRDEGEYKSGSGDERAGQTEPGARETESAEGTDTGEAGGGHSGSDPAEVEEVDPGSDVTEDGKADSGPDSTETGKESVGSDLDTIGGDGVDSDADPAADEDGSLVAEAGDTESESESVEVVVDQRELDANIARDLSMREEIETRLETLSVGDYVLSDRVVVERKTVEDFLETLTGGDRSMFEQVGDGARNYSRPVVVIEGDGLYERRNLHPNAIHGALASLAVDFGASVMRTADEDETADLLAVLAGREQEDGNRSVSVHGEKQSRTLPEQQEYVVASIAEVGPVTARSLLTELGGVEAVMTADRETLMTADGVGEVTAERIREVVGSSYGES
ncbi:MAG: ERCC4-type nuclease [halophilic archaeon J07HX64]|jgi:ERCC4-type nuclease|nr:MAG: ERCC4-type nuclease [halophilic archaeon J07HX64]